jgi:hypothetical protein
VYPIGFSDATHCRAYRWAEDLERVPRHLDAERHHSKHWPVAQPDALEGWEPEIALHASAGGAVRGFALENIRGVRVLVSEMNRMRLVLIDMNIRIAGTCLAAMHRSCWWAIRRRPATFCRCSELCLSASGSSSHAPLLTPSELASSPQGEAMPFFMELYLSPSELFEFRSCELRVTGWHRFAYVWLPDLLRWTNGGGDGGAAGSAGADSEVARCCSHAFLPAGEYRSGRSGGAWVMELLQGDAVHVLMERGGLDRQTG